MSEPTPVVSQPEVEKSATPQSKAAKASRDKKRFEKKRVVESTKTDNQNKNDIYKKLYYGFRNSNDAARAMQISVVPRSIILPTTTRSIGFIIRYLLVKFFRLGLNNIDFYTLGCSLYRISLLQFENKMMQSMCNQYSRNIGQGDFRNIDLTSSSVRAVAAMGAGFAPITNVISALGVVKGFGTVYIPRFPVMKPGPAGLCPGHVTISNLRSIVEYLSSPVTPVEVRRCFYEHSPIPTAKWSLPTPTGKRPKPTSSGQDPAAEVEIVDDFPLLVNPDDVMPNNYGMDHIHHDIEVISAGVEKIGRKYEKYISTGGIDYFSLGNFTQLVSNDLGPIRCPSWSESTGVAGTMSDYWSSEALGDAEMFLGAFHLFGEIPEVKRTASDVYVVRDFKMAKSESDIDYMTSLQNALG